MPIYGYDCKSCKKEFESVSSKATTAEEEIQLKLVPSCPHCGSKSVKRGVAKRTSFVLKGNDWARDHYGIRRKHK